MANSHPNETARGKGRPFKKGQSGNPSGRPKRLKPELKALKELYVSKVVPDRKETWEQVIALRLLRTAAEGHVPAITELYNRIHGKVTDPVQVTGKDGGPIQVEEVKHLTDEQLEQIISRGSVISLSSN